LYKLHSDWNGSILLLRITLILLFILFVYFVKWIVKVYSVTHQCISRMQIFGSCVWGNSCSWCGKYVHNSCATPFCFAYACIYICMYVCMYVRWWSLAQCVLWYWLLVNYIVCIYDIMHMYMHAHAYKHFKQCMYVRICPLRYTYRNRLRLYVPCALLWL
jgi:hypothetical protein